METLISFGFIILFICLIVGLVKPSAILKWDKKPSRIKVFIYWLFSSTLVGFLIPTDDQVNEGQFNYNLFEEKYDINLLDEEVNEMGVIKAQISQSIYFGKIDSSLIEGEIELFLKERLRRLDDRKGFKNFNTASHVIIWLHESKNHAIEGGSNWIAMINKMGEEDNVSFTLNKVKLEYVKNPIDSVINNLSTEVRKEIFRAIAYVEDKALNEANSKFPNGNDWEKNYDYNKKLLKRYYKKFYKHYSINKGVSTDILSEGLTKGWLEKTGVISFKL